jgi:hypothetical protein
LTQQFQISGVNVVPDSGSADRTVSLVLTEFWDGEDPDYDARILCTLKITDKTGSVLYSAPVSGHYDERGHSLSIDDYQDCMSNAVVDLAATLLADPKIIAVLTAH